MRRDCLKMRSLRRLYRSSITRLALEIALLDKRLAEIISTDVVLAARFRILTSMPFSARSSPSR